MENEITATGPFAGVSFAEQLAAWKAWPTDRRPEEHNAVAPFARAPPAGVEFQILGSVSIRKAWLDQGMIQCNVCRTERKFGTNEGYVATFPDGWWYIVGPICGSEAHQGRVNLAVNHHLRREAELRADDNIKIFLSKRQEWLAYRASLRDATNAVYAIWKALKAQPKVFSALSSAARAGGALKLQWYTSQRDARGRLVVHEKLFGRMTGGDFLLAFPSPSAAMRDVERELSFLLTSVDQAKIDAEIYAAHEHGDLSRASAKLKEQLEFLRNAADQVIDAASFVAPANLALIKKWSMHGESACAAEFFYFEKGGVLHMPKRPGEGDGNFLLDLNVLRAFEAKPPY